MADNEDAERRMKAKLNKAKKAKKKRSKAKKAAEEEAKGGAAAKRVQTEEVEMKTKESNNRNEDEEGLEFEDQFEDEFEEEELVRDKDDEEEEDDEDEEAHVPASYYAPSKQGEEELDYDPTAYVALHRMTFEWPALSFDFFRDHMGSDRTRFPTSIWMAAGSQTESGRDNGINLLRISSINRTKEEEEEDVVIMEDGADDGDGAEGKHVKVSITSFEGNHLTNKQPSYLGESPSEPRRWQRESHSSNAATTRTCCDMVRIRKSPSLRCFKSTLDITP
jgi:ribosome assembly protein RRB1